MSTYTPLLSTPDVHDDEWGSLAQKRDAAANPPSWLRRVADAADRTVCFVFVACLISLLSLAVNIARLHSSGPSAAPAAPTKLRYPNPYIGLEHAVLAHPAPRTPIVNFPLLLAQINSSAPNAVGLQQPHFSTSFGMIYPEDREFLVQEAVSTIAQFRTLDFRMERCVAVLEIPSAADIRDFPNKTVELLSDGPRVPLELWFLDAGEDIEPQTLSWARRPKRARLLSRMDVTHGAASQGVQLESPAFACPARTLATLEISCSTPGCRLWFRQDKKLPRLGELEVFRVGVGVLIEALSSVLSEAVSERRVGADVCR
ncbi:hypothetical protein C8R46DRAFT_912454 [Mycena filopes]|nr:hypothetical protein C8R46DRAFT_912454 [Mycena filopes]